MEDERGPAVRPAHRIPHPASHTPHPASTMRVCRTQRVHDSAFRLPHSPVSLCVRAAPHPESEISQIFDFPQISCAESRCGEQSRASTRQRGLDCSHVRPRIGRLVIGTFAQPFQSHWLRSETPTATWSLPLTDHTPHGQPGLLRGVVISGEVRCHIGASTTSLSPAPRAGYPATLAACCTSSTSVRSSGQPSGTVDVAAFIAEPHWVSKTLPWIM